MLKSEQNDTNTKIAATLVCNARDVRILTNMNYKKQQSKDKMQS